MLPDVRPTGLHMCSLGIYSLRSEPGTAGPVQDEQGDDDLEEKANQERGNEVHLRSEHDHAADKDHPGEDHDEKAFCISHHGSLP